MDEMFCESTQKTCLDKTKGSIEDGKAHKNETSVSACDTHKISTTTIIAATHICDYSVSEQSRG